MMSGNAPDRPGASYTNASTMIERVRTGMNVIDANGNRIGVVKFVKMGDPEAATPVGQGEPGPDYQNVLTGDVRDVYGDEVEPDVTDPARSRMLRTGFIRIDAAGLAGLVTRDRYASADEIADVSGDAVTLSVSKDQLVTKR